MHSSNLVSVMVDHAFRAITFRHSGAGLASVTARVIVFCVALSMALAYFRWGIPGQAIAHAVLILVIAAAVSPRLAAGYALLSVGIDAVAIPVEMAAGRDVRAFFWWELLAGVYLAFRMARNGML